MIFFGMELVISPLAAGSSLPTSASRRMTMTALKGA
ncbi:hypothetical protein SAMN05880593_12860 [Rhizobium sp. RU36D]|nr:hypothetical protein SAMN05880593_12860 [Rhizobium sp. RU36D]